MRQPEVLLRAGWVLAAVLLLPWAAHDVYAEDSYQVQPGDVLQVSVWKEEDLQREVVVRPDGGISFPLVGEVAAAGRGVEEIRGAISSRLNKYIPDPVVTVAVSQIVGNKIYVEGKVNRPGEFVVTRQVDVLQALSMAGGMNVFAAQNDIKVLRRVDGRQVVFPFRYADVVNGENLGQNIVLQTGDIVLVP